MKNSDLFFYPGKVLADFVLSLFNKNAVEIDPWVFSALIFVLAFWIWCWVWCWVLRISIAIIKKTFGFDQRRPY